MAEQAAAQGAGGTVPQPTVHLTAEEFLGRYAKAVYAAAKRMQLRRSDAEDVLSRTGEIALAKPAPADEDEQLRWVYAIAWRVAQNVRRKKRPATLDPAALAESERDAQPPPVEELIRTERLQALHDAIATLSPRDRRIVEHLFLAPRPLSYSELADLLGVKTDSVGPLRLRALDRLRKQLRLRGF